MCYFIRLFLRAIRIAPQLCCSRNSTYIRIPPICFRKSLLPHSAVHRSKTLCVSSLSGIRPIKNESSKIVPASSQIFAASFLALLIYCTYSLFTYPIWPLYLILLQSPSVPISSAESPPESTPSLSAVSLAEARTLILVVAVTVPIVSATAELSAACRNSVLI